MSLRFQSRRGFALAEVIVVLVVSTIVTAAVLTALVALVRSLHPSAIQVGGEALPIAPTFSAFPAAVALHATFAARTAEARAVYVFGGRHLSIPATSSASALRPLRVLALPRITAFSAGLPLDARAFYDAYAQALGDQVVAASADDYSVVVIGPSGGQLAVTCFVQVSRSAASVSDGDTPQAFVIRRVRLWDIAGESRQYAFAEPAGAARAVFVGAVHTWMRYSSGGAVAEEGPACVVFPDPWVYAGKRGRADDIPPFSRFSYLLAVSP